MNFIATVILFAVALAIVLLVKKPVIRFIRNIIPTDAIKGARGRKLANAAITSFVCNAMMLIILSLMGVPFNFFLCFVIVLAVEYFSAKD